MDGWMEINGEYLSAQIRAWKWITEWTIFIIEEVEEEEEEEEAENRNQKGKYEEKKNKKKKEKKKKM